MPEQTALQMVIDWIDSCYDKGVIPRAIEIRSKAIELLPVDKKQIEDAWNEGYGRGGLKSKSTGEDYYRTKYGEE